MNIVSLTLQIVDVPLEIVQLVTQRPVYASIVIAHAVSIGLFLQELLAKGQSLYIYLSSRVHKIYCPNNMWRILST